MAYDDCTAADLDAMHRSAAVLAMMHYDRCEQIIRDQRGTPLADETAHAALFADWNICHAAGREQEDLARSVGAELRVRQEEFRNG